MEFSGSICNITKCFGIESGDINVCNKHGKCNSFNNCTCDIGYTGSDCIYPICFGIPDSINFYILKYMEVMEQIVIYLPVII